MLVRTFPISAFTRTYCANNSRDCPLAELLKALSGVRLSLSAQVRVAFGGKMKRLLLVMIVFAYATSRSTHAQTNSPPVTPCPNSGQYTLTGDGEPFEQLRLECDPNKRL